MTRELIITTEPIPETDLIAGTKPSSKMGAILRFSGVVRDSEDGKPISGIDYECFQPMAERQFHLLFDQMEKDWPIDSVRLIHRIGRVAAGEPSLWVEIASPHRGEAFAACQWLIEEMKKVVPIWKKPY